MLLTTRTRHMVDESVHSSSERLARTYIKIRIVVQSLHAPHNSPVMHLAIGRSLRRHLPDQQLNSTTHRNSRLLFDRENDEPPSHTVKSTLNSVDNAVPWQDTIDVDRISWGQLRLLFNFHICLLHMPLDAPVILIVFFRCNTFRWFDAGLWHSPVAVINLWIFDLSIEYFRIRMLPNYAIESHLDTVKTINVICGHRFTPDEHTTIQNYRSWDHTRGASAIYSIKSVKHMYFCRMSPDVSVKHCGWWRRCHSVSHLHPSHSVTLPTCRWWWRLLTYCLCTPIKGQRWYRLHAAPTLPHFPCAWYKSAPITKRCIRTYKSNRRIRDSQYSVINATQVSPKRCAVYG